MKKVIILLIIFLQSGVIFAQSIEELKDAESITWFGVDFSETRFVGKYDFKSPWELKDKLIPEWNQLILREPEKYDISKYFHKSKVETELGDVYDRNSKIDESEIIIGFENSEHELNEEKIQDIVSEYTTEYTGYGLVFIVESFNKSMQKGTVWVTFFHIPTKQVILTKKMHAEPMGFGIKNYWARVFYRVMQECETSLSL
jgi:hypothetical protein